MSRLKKEQLPEKISGAYSAIPHSVLDSIAFQGATDKAKSLLYALMRQHNGRNNGHLHLAKAWLLKQGWTCDENNRKAKHELEERSLIVQTKQGGLNMGADLFAVTWLPVSNFVGLEMTDKIYPRGAYSLCKLPPTKRRKPPITKKAQPDDRACTCPAIEPAKPTTSTTAELISDDFIGSTGTTTEHNVVIPIPTNKMFQIV